MKKIISALVICLVSTVTFSQKRIGDYNMSFFDGKQYEILASEPEAGKFDIFITVEGEHKYDDVKLNVASKDLEAFKSTLIQVRDKYVEWEKKAKENNVKDTQKDFPFSLKNVDVAWYGSKWWFAFNQTFTPVFFVFKNGDCAMVISEKVTASNNEYIDQKFYFVLQTEEEFNQVINYLDKKIVYDYYSNKGKTDDLFQ